MAALSFFRRTAIRTTPGGPSHAGGTWKTFYDDDVFLNTGVSWGGEAEELRDVVTTFPISQDQRNSVSAQFRFEPHPRIWFALGGRYGSGLPVSPRLERYSYFAPESS